VFTKCKEPFLQTGWVGCSRFADRSTHQYPIPPSQRLGRLTIRALESAPRSHVDKQCCGTGRFGRVRSVVVRSFWTSSHLIKFRLPRMDRVRVPMTHAVCVMYISIDETRMTLVAAHLYFFAGKI
jgi:hypothetical protein